MTEPAMTEWVWGLRVRARNDGVGMVIAGRCPQ